jgi:hypothetical protein
MPSFAESDQPGLRADAPRRSRRIALEGWNRRLHYYLGLFFLLFIWLFSLTGLLLNHPRWAQHASDRRAESKYERKVEIVQGLATDHQARNVMRQLGLEGELDWPAQTPAGRLDFNVSRPNDASQVRIDLANGTAAVQHFENTPFAAFRIFHTFNGSRYNAPLMGREWAWTTVWTVLMDAFAAGLIVMVLGSYYMWYRLKRDHRLGWAVLGSGLACCALFVLALR